MSVGIRIRAQSFLPILVLVAGAVFALVEDSQAVWAQGVLPEITGIEPAEPIARSTRQELIIDGSRFVQGSQVVLRIGSSEYPIPPDRTEFINASKIRVSVGLTDIGTWTAQVVNPGEVGSNIFTFYVFGPPGSFAVDDKLVSLINQFAANFHDKNWKVSLSQFKAWIALITLQEVGRLGYAAHSDFNCSSHPLANKGTGDCFPHRDIGTAFQFSTGIGAFQLDRFGSHSNSDTGNHANETWHAMPTIVKIDPVQSLLSLLRWHRDYFDGNNPNVQKFWERSPWLAVRRTDPNTGERTWETTWKLITGDTWESSATEEKEVTFDPPRKKDPFGDSVKYLGRILWFVWNQEGEPLATWLIKARRFGGPDYEYYYTKRDDLKQEAWVYKNPSPTEPSKHFFKRDYRKSGTELPALPDPVPHLNETGRFVAGDTKTPRALDPGATTSNAADCNNDGKVNFVDLSILLWNWKKSNPTTCDVNQDGIVNIYDLSILLSSWTG